MFLLVDYEFACDNQFEGGGWLLVRFHNLYSQPRWYRATDGLRGTDVYGYPGLGRTEYSLYYSNLLKPESELLFVIGAWFFLTKHVLSSSSRVF